jgi:hypothetical protein
VARRVAIAAAGAAAFVGLVILIYVVSAHGSSGDSDKATAILEGQAIAHGNVLLRSWILPLDSFWTVDALVYGLLTLVSGVHAGLLNFGPALIGAGVIAGSAGLARHGTRGAAAIAGAATVVALLAFPTVTEAFFFAGQGYHVGTALWALLAFWLLREGRFGWSWAVGSFVLAVAALGDLEIFDYAMVPIALGGIFAMARLRDWRAAAAPVAGVALAAGLAEATRRILDATGAFAVSRGLPLAKPHQVFVNIWNVLRYGADLVAGHTSSIGKGGIPVALEYVHVAGAIVIVASIVAGLVALVIGIVRGSRRPGAGADTDGRTLQLWRLDDVLLLACVGAMTSYAAQSLSNDLGGVRYLAPAVIFAAILSGRMVARAWPKVTARSLRTAFALGGTAVVACFAAATGYYVARPAISRPSAPLAAWLEEHHLTNGIGDYWAASIVTVASQGNVTVRPVNTLPNGKLVRIMNQSAASWYQGQNFQFLVYGQPIWAGVDTQAAIATFGQPAHSYLVDGYYVLVYPHFVHVAPIAPSP